MGLVKSYNSIKSTQVPVCIWGITQSKKVLNTTHGWDCMSTCKDDQYPVRLGLAGSSQQLTEEFA